MAKKEFVEADGLRVEGVLFDFLMNEALPGTGISEQQFWKGLAEIVQTLGPRHQELLAVREQLQATIDAWHRHHAGEPHDVAGYRELLRSIGYLVPTGEPFSIDTTNIDPEIALIAGPQLVVPSTNARYALNAANARWGSLYDALYGTDALGDLPTGTSYDPVRGARVIAWARGFLDDVVPLEGASHADVMAYRVDRGALIAEL